MEELLIKYIGHVKAIEGISFIDREVHLSAAPQLTDEEREELLRLETISDLRYRL